MFNYRMSTGRLVIGNALGILPNKLRLLLRTFEQRPGTARDIVGAAVVLQNLLRQMFIGPSVRPSVCLLVTLQGNVCTDMSDTIPNNR